MEVLEKAKNLIANQVKENRIFVSGEPFQGVQKTYFWTNENITASLNHVDLNNTTNALSVLASGDQLFSLISAGVINVDTFDINLLAEYYVFGLKRALILKNDYETFMQIMNLLITSNNSSQILSIIYDHLPYMDEKYRLFWQELIDYTNHIQKEYGTNQSLIKMLFLRNTSSYLETGVNYLASNQDYQNLQKNLEKSNITFKSVDILELPQEYSMEYDLIILSNILDYMIKHWGYGWDYSYIQDFEQKLDHILSPKGILLLKYILGYSSLSGFTRNTLFIASKVQKSDLITESIYQIPSIINKNNDGIILKRGKN